MLTISQLAAYAGVSIRTVRWYHQRGLLPEPARDASGYRRYDGQAVVDLVRIRTLAGAGVPLARIGELLQPDEEEFRVAIKEVDAELAIRMARAPRCRHQGGRSRIAGMPDTIALLSRALSQMTTVLEHVPANSLDAATPCRDWTVRELLRHIVRQNLRNFTASARGETTDWSATPPELGDNWVEDYRHGANELLETWRAADLDQKVPVPGGAEAPLRSRADHQITELCVHAWDLSRAAQISGTLDDELAEHALAWSRQMLQPQFRGQGKSFGNEVPVPANAPAYDRLAGWFGRDPHWQPPEPLTH